MSNLARFSTTTKRVLIAVLTVFTFAALGCGATATNETVSNAPAAETTATTLPAITVKMLDVGQGDAILIQSPDETVLIDCGDIDERDNLRRELKKANVSVIDKVILTHPHADHIGGMDVLLKEYTVKEVYDNDVVRDLPVYVNYLKALKKDGIKRQPLKDGDVLKFCGATFSVLSPTEQSVASWNDEFRTYAAERKKDKNTNKPKHNFNMESIVGRLQYGEFTMLFTGDAEKEIETEHLLKNHRDELKSDVLKSPHHGSKTSSSPDFLDAVAPKYAVISLGANNDYGHPHGVTLKKYDARGIKTLRTDLNGTITITTDGKKYDFAVEKEGGQ